jgi:chaperonin cofactor prefoldin
MTSNATRQELEKIKEDTEAQIKTLELEITHLKSVLSEVKGQIFRLINAEFTVTHSASPIKLINERK